MNTPLTRELPAVEDVEDAVPVAVDARLTAREEEVAERPVVEEDATAVKSITSETL